MGFLLLHEESVKWKQGCFMRTDMDVTEATAAFRNRFANAPTTVRAAAIRNLPDTKQQ